MFLALRKRQPTGGCRVEDDPVKLWNRRFRQKKEIFALLKKKYMDPFGGIRSESPPKIEANGGGRPAAGERSSMPGAMAFRPD